MIPTIFDSGIGEDRPVTQADVDRLVRVQLAYSQLRLGVQKLIHETLSLANNDDAPKPMLGAMRTISE